MVKYFVLVEVDMKQYRIGELDVLIDPGPIELNDNLLTEEFIHPGEVGAQTLYIRTEVTDLSFLQEWEIELYTGAYEIRRKDHRRFLLHHWMTYRFAFGLYLDELFCQGEIHLYCNRLPEPICMTTARFIGSTGIHHRLLQRDSAVIHASYIDYKGKGILFTAPSQTGKSTQAELWRLHNGAEILNGDRALLLCREDGVSTGGYIACGSSAICKNRLLPLGAIVLLAQGPENVIRPATTKERVHALFSAMEFFHWSSEDLDCALSLANRIAAQAPIFHLICRPDEDAVRTLQHCLEAENIC